MLKFFDDKIVNLDINNPDGMKELIIEHFCGLKSYPEITLNDTLLLKKIINDLKKKR